MAAEDRDPITKMLVSDPSEVAIVPERSMQGFVNMALAMQMMQGLVGQVLAMLPDMDEEEPTD